MNSLRLEGRAVWPRLELLLSLFLSPLSFLFLFSPSSTRELVHRRRNSPQAPTRQFSLECPPGLYIRHRLYTGVKGNVCRVAKRSWNVTSSSTISVHLLENRVLLLQYTQEYISHQSTVTKTESKYTDKISVLQG